MAGKVRENSRRQIGMRVFATYLPKLNKALSENTFVHREFREEVLVAITDAVAEEYPKAPMSRGSLGALYNDVKDVNIREGKCPPFGRYGKGSNGSVKKEVVDETASGTEKTPVVETEPTAAPEAEQLPWVLVHKESKKIVAEFASSTKARKAKTPETTVKKAADVKADQPEVKEEAEA